MLPTINKAKGIHPGLILERECKLRGINKKELASKVGEYPQTISAICKQKRSITPLLSLHLEHELGAEEGYFLALQAYFDIKQAKLADENNSLITPNLSIFRRVVFWDTDFDKINWTKQYKAIIKRVFERGNEEEIAEIISFYGKELIIKTLSLISNPSPGLLLQKNKYLI